MPVKGGRDQNVTRLSVFIASSVDGFIATEDDDLGWLESAAHPDEDYGYDAFMDTVDALAMGRGTYDHIAHVDPLPFGERPVYVFTSRPPCRAAWRHLWRENPGAALRRWTEAGLRRVYVDGGQLISSFLAEDLIDDMLLTKVAVLLGSGRLMFHPIAASARLNLEQVTPFPKSGFVNLAYTRW